MKTTAIYHVTCADIVYNVKRICIKSKHKTNTILVKTISTLESPQVKQTS